MNDKRYNILVILAIVVSIVCLSVAFATLSTTLSINGTTYLKASSWSIQYQTPINFLNSAGGHFVDNPVGGNVEGEPSVLGTTVYFQAELDDRGDFIQFDLPIKNTGTINAKLDSYLANISGVDRDLLILTVVDSNGDSLVGNDMILDANETKTITVKLMYDPAASTMPDGDDVAVTISLTWKQK